ncbi:hypothetical protein Scep_026548 [Stephania cephalantha]|uniref:Uncharacterized protein n=1 Tax=Stephania cephalantha TaxID=152367 RepID=A0AAP0EU80_9MAGN
MGLPSGAQLIVVGGGGVYDPVTGDDGGYDPVPPPSAVPPRHHHHLLVRGLARDELVTRTGLPHDDTWKEGTLFGSLERTSCMRRIQFVYLEDGSIAAGTRGMVTYSMMWRDA